MNIVPQDRPTGMAQEQDRQAIRGDQTLAVELLQDLLQLDLPVARWTISEIVGTDDYPMLVGHLHRDQNHVARYELGVWAHALAGRVVVGSQVPHNGLVRLRMLAKYDGIAVEVWTVVSDVQDDVEESAPEVVRHG